MNFKFLQLKRIGIDTHQEPVVYMRKDCHICQAEGFSAQSRVKIILGKHHIIATLSVVTGDWLSHKEAGLSEVAWLLLNAKEGDKATFAHPRPVDSMSAVRGKLYDQALTQESASAIINDINQGRYSDIQLAAYITACSGQRLSIEETIYITRAMVDSGQRFNWPQERVLDKHCVGGLPGNRTTPIVVAIVAANNLVMPKTSSRAITSPAGTADTMECLTDVTLSFEHMNQVVTHEGACLAWGGSVALSPTDDIIIRVERALDLDSEGQMVASVISKKIAAGSTHVLIDIPVGPTAKVRSLLMAQRLAKLLTCTAEKLGLVVKTIISDGSQPVGNGIGPALEARDVLQVLKNESQAPPDLRQRALTLSAALLEMGGVCCPREGLALAEKTLNSGQALTKFLSICQAQGGLKELTLAPFQHVVKASKAGVINSFNNRIISRLASLAGAPNAMAAGLDLHVKCGEKVQKGTPLMTIHAQAQGELEYAMAFLHEHDDAILICEDTVL